MRKLILLLLCLPLYGQSFLPTTFDYGSQQIMALAPTGSIVTPGQLLKLGSDGRLIPTVTTDTSGVVAVATTGAPQAGTSIIINLFGVTTIQVDGPCTIAQFITISSITAGMGHCTNGIPTTQIIGTAWAPNSNASVQGFLNFGGGISGGGGGGGSGTVTSVGLSLPSPLFTISNSPVTANGILTGSFGSIGAHLYLGNNSGTSATAGLVQPACGDLSNGAASCSTDTTNASNISSGTLAAAREGAISLTAAGNGGVQANQGTTTTVLHGNAAGQPSFGAVNLGTDVTGNLPVANLNSGTAATNSTFWRGDGTWAAPPGGGTINNANQYDPTYYSGAGASSTVSGMDWLSGLDGVPQFLVEKTSAGVNTIPVPLPAGITPNAQTGTSYTVVATDRTKYLTFSNAAAIAVTLPQAGTTGFNNNFAFIACDIGAGTTTITPTTSTISFTNGSAYTSAAASMTLATGQCGRIYSDNSNYFAERLQSGGTVNSIATTSPISGGTITTSGTISCPTCVTSAASLTNHAVVIGQSGQGAATIGADTTTTHALFATATDPAFRAIATGDIPFAVVNNNTNTGTSAMTLDMSASTTADSLKVPVQAGCTSGSSGSVCYDSTAGHTHIRDAGSDSVAFDSKTTTHALEAALLCADTSASGSAQVCNTSPTFTPASGDCVIYTTTTANTGTALTLNVNSLGAKSVAKWQGSTTLAANDVLANKQVMTCYDGTNWELGWIGNAPSGSGTVNSATQGQWAYYAAAGTAVSGAGPGTAKQVALSNGTSGPQFIDFPEVLIIPAANCNNTTAGAAWSIGSGGTVTCRAGTNNLGGYVSITDTSSTFATFQFVLPEDWDTANNPYIRFQIASTDATNAHTIIPSIQVACYKGDGSTTDDVAANAAHSLSTTTLNGNANRFWSTSNVQMNSTDMTGCVAGALVQVTVGRATDTATNAEFYSATITIPRLLTVQAN